MANQIPIWLTGRGVSSVLVRYQLAAADGTLGNGSGSATDFAVLGLLDSIDLNGNTLTTNVVALNSTLENETPYLIDDSFTLTEILQSNRGGNFLASLYMNAQSAQQILITITRGGNTWTGVLVMIDYGETIRRPKSTGEMICRMISVRDSITGLPILNPAYA